MLYRHEKPARTACSVTRASSFALVLAATFITSKAPCLAQGGSTSPAFVATTPVYGVVGPNTGIISASFQVSAKSVNQSLSFVVSSSNGALGLSATSDCSQSAPSIGAGTPATLFTCLDTQKIVGGRYVFLLKIRSQQFFLGLGDPGSANKPNDAASDCTPTPPVLDVPVVVNVSSSSAVGSIKTSVDTVNLDSNNLTKTFLISYVPPSGGGGAASIDSIQTVPPVQDEGAWLSLSTDCPSMSFATTCSVTVAANPFKLVGAVAGQTYTAVVGITGVASNTADRQDVTVKFIYFNPVVSQLFPHLADGDDWQTDFILTNTTFTNACVDLLFHMDGGASLSSSPGLPGLTNVGGFLGIPNIFLAANGGSAQFRTLGSTSFQNPNRPPLVTGWVEIRSQSQIPITGQAIFRRRPTDGSTYEGSVPVIAPVATFSIAYDRTDFLGSTRVTAIAIANPDPTNLVSVTCIDSAISAPVLTLNNLGVYSHTGGAFNLTNVPNPKGTVICNSTRPIGVLGVLFLGPHGFSTLDVHPN